MKSCGPVSASTFAHCEIDAGLETDWTAATFDGSAYYCALNSRFPGARRCPTLSCASYGEIRMRKTLLLATGSIIALCTGSASAFQQPAPTHSGSTIPFPPVTGANVLYNQNSDDAGTSINSQNYTSGSSQYNDQAADDFVIPKGQTWRITEVDVTGQYFNGSTTATSENVIFYKNDRGMPGNPVTNGTFTNLNGTGGPDFALILPGKGLKLRSGHYWASVVANMQFFTNGGEWGWEVSSVKHERQAMWQNPGQGLGDCPTWGTIETCAFSPGPDLMFTLRGRTM